MSWSEFLPNKTLDELRDAQPKSEVTRKAHDQWEAALGCVIEIIQSGVVGNTDEFKFSVSLSGHSNNEHRPAEGWANDAISLSINQVVPD